MFVESIVRNAHVLNYLLQKSRKYIKDIVFKANLYDICVANQIKSGK